MTWAPLIPEPNARAEYLALATKILDALEDGGVQQASTQDLCDAAILAAYLGRDDAAAGFLASAIKAFQSTPWTRWGLFGGAAHVAWSVAHLADGSDADFLADAVQDWIARGIDEGKPVEHDLVSGLAGFAVLAAERAMTPSGARFGREIVELLEQTASVRDEGIAWFTAPESLPPWQRELAPEGYWNLGLAHGTPGVIASLAMLARVGIEPARCLALIEGAVSYTLAVKQSHDHWSFPAWHPHGINGGQRGHRLAWCYGDLGVAAALMSAGLAAKRETWRLESISLALRTARTTLALSGVSDAGLCHGSAGVAHVFNRLYQLTNEPALAEAARFWLSHTVTLRRDDGIAGYPALKGTRDVAAWVADGSLLTGAAGVALAVHAATTDVEPSWDRLLVVDLRSHE